ncbi:MAG: energy transducer TonB, partial [Gammaproteobacteria bacterium]
AALVQGRAQSAVESSARLRKTRFRVTVRLWFSPEGRTARVELAGSTGSPELDAELERSLAGMPKLPEAPPKGMPQPMVLRVSTS